MSKVPAILRNKLIQLAIGFAAGTSVYMSVQAPSHEVQLAMELGAHYESSGRHIGAPYVDKLGKGQPLTVCNGVTGPEVQLGKYYTKEDCQRLELPKYFAAEKAAKRIFKHWGQYNVWVRASFIDMIYNLGESAVAASSMVRLANAGDLLAACAQMPRWVRGTVNGQSVPLPGLIDRRATTQELCRDWGRDGHFTAVLVSQGVPMLADRLPKLWLWLGAAALGAAGGWLTNGWRLGQDIAQIQLAHTQELAARDAGTFAVAQAIDTNYQGALNASIQEQTRLAGAAAVATRNAGRLRDQLSEADERIATASATAVRDYAATANQLLGQCSDRYTELAAKLMDTPLMRESAGQLGQ